MTATGIVETTEEAVIHDRDLTWTDLPQLWCLEVHQPCCRWEYLCGGMGFSHNVNSGEPPSLCVQSGKPPLDGNRPLCCNRSRKNYQETLPTLRKGKCARRRKSFTLHVVPRKDEMDQGNTQANTLCSQIFRKIRIEKCANRPRSPEHFEPRVLQIPSLQISKIRMTGDQDCSNNTLSWCMIFHKLDSNLSYKHCTAHEGASAAVLSSGSESRKGLHNKTCFCLRRIRLDS